jgi:sulfate transport system permease protein
MMARLGLRVVALGYLAFLLLLPVGLLLWRTCESGLGPVWAAISTPDAVHALYLSALIAVIAVPLNTIFGVLCSLLLVRHSFPGKGLINAFLELPLGISPVVVGLALVLVYGQFGWLGGWFLERNVQIIFAVPGMVLATIFISLPFVAREVVPVLREIGTEAEEAARTLGASPWQTFRRITLPAIRGGIGYGVVLATARALGEFGAVSVVSGRLLGQTQTLPLYVENRFEGLDTTAAYTASMVLALMAVVTLLAMTALKPREHS